MRGPAHDGARSSAEAPYAAFGVGRHPVYIVCLGLGLSALTANDDILLLVGTLMGWQSGERNPVIQARLRDIALRPATPEGAVVMLGDSIMEGLDPAAIGPDVINFGVSGRTAVVLGETLPEWHALVGARNIVLGIGVNDLSYRPNEAVVRDDAALVGR